MRAPERRRGEEGAFLVILALVLGSDTVGAVSPRGHVANSCGQTHAAL